MDIGGILTHILRLGYRGILGGTGDTVDTVIFKSRRFYVDISGILTNIRRRFSFKLLIVLIKSNQGKENKQKYFFKL